MLRKNINSKKINFIWETIFILILVLSFVNLQAQEFPNVGISGTQLRTIYSSIVGQEYVLDINLPRDYKDTTKTFPVVYLLDSQWDFPLTQAIYGQQYYDGFLPGVIIVGITWGGENPNPDVLRARDFTPTDVGQNGATGNAANFLDFIGKELIPFIEKNYRVTDDRTLMGSSLGGLFTLYTLFHHHELFKRFVCTSPAILWDNGVIFTYEKKYAEKNKELNAKLFMALGGFEKGWLPYFEKLTAQIKGRNYKGFELQTKIIEGIGHSGGKADGYTRGLQFVFAKPSIDVDDSILQQYAGEYQYNPRAKIKLVVEDGNLFVITPDNLKIRLYAETENDFYQKGEYVFAHFERDESGKVTGFLLQRYGGDSFVKKITE